MTAYSPEELAQAADALRRLLDAVDRRDLADSPATTRRLEDAIVPLKALAAGQVPSAEDFG